MASSALPSTSEHVPGPLGCRYDDKLTELEIKLVIPGIKKRTIMRASNTQVHLKYDEQSMSLFVEIVKVDKQQKPPVKSVVDRRFFEVKKFPAPVRDVNFHLEKDCCVLHVHKKAPGSWANELSQRGF